MSRQARASAHEPYLRAIVATVGCPFSCAQMAYVCVVRRGRTSEASSKAVMMRSSVIEMERVISICASSSARDQEPKRKLINVKDGPCFAFAHSR